MNLLPKADYSRVYRIPLGGNVKKKIPSPDMPSRYPGLQQYLEMESDKRKEMNYSQYNKRIREVADWALGFLTLVCEKQDEQELGKVFTEEKLDKLTNALLERKSRGSGNLQQTMPRYTIASMFMEKGIMKCLELVKEPYAKMVHDSAKELMMTLTWLVMERYYPTISLLNLPSVLAPWKSAWGAMDAARTVEK